MWRGYLGILAAAVLWALIGPVAKFAFQAGLSPLEVAFWRAGGGGAFFILHCLAKGTLRVAPRDLPGVALFGLPGVALFFGAYQVAVFHGGAALASILLYTAPAWVALLSPVFLGERLGGRTLVAVAMAMAGAWLVCAGAGAGAIGTGGGGVSLLAVGAGLCSGLTYSLHYLYGKRYLPRYAAATLYAWCLPVGALALAPFTDFHWSLYGDPRAYGAILFSGLGSAYLAYYFYCMALRELAATETAVLANLEPVVAAFFAWLWWDEVFTATGYLGGALVVAAVVLLSLKGRRKYSRPAA